ncbi:MAG: prolipoprotein diacylglyceryl transferase [Proteobacteria bacterium]|nr:prolipoprotein diacylglyceryl transferase [Pseudomonadota bacterium]
MDTIIIWDVDPELFRVGGFAIRWYGLLYATAFLAGTTIMSRIFALENKPAKSIDRLLIYMLVAVVVGARLGEILFYNLEYYLQNPFKIFRVWEGGLSSHGGFVGIFTALYFYSKKTPDQPYLWILDRICIVVAFAGILIRIGNFINSEIIGIPTNGAWGVVFKNVDNIPRHPAQLYESLMYLGVFLLLLAIYKLVDTTKKQGLLIGVFLTVGFSLRFLNEFVKENLGFAKNEAILNTGQLLSIPVILIGLFLLWKGWNHDKPK